MQTCTNCRGSFSSQNFSTKRTTAGAKVSDAWCRRCVNERSRLYHAAQRELKTSPYSTYVFYDPSTGRYKVGKAKNYDQRMREHRITIPQLIEMYRTPGYTDVEAYLIYKCRNFVMQGREWVAELPPSLIKFLEKNNTLGRAS